MAAFFRDAFLIVYVLYRAPIILWKCVFYCPIFCSCSYPCKHFVCMSWDLFVVFPGFSYEKKGTATVKSRLLFILPQLSCEKIEEGKEKQQETGEVFFKWRWWQRGRFFIFLSFERTFCLHTILMESSNFIEYLLHVCIAPRSDHCLTMRICFAKRWCLRKKQIKVVTCICVFFEVKQKLYGVHPMVVFLSHSRIK